MPGMTRMKRAATISSTFAFALGIGFVMQNGDASAARYATDDPSLVHKPVMIIDYSPLREMTEFRLKPEPNTNHPASSIAIDPDSVKLVALVEDIAVEDDGALFAQTRPSPAEKVACDILAAAVPDTTGAVTVTILSECRSNAAFTVNHSGVTFSGKTDDNGMSILTVPAMSAEATFFISFEDGKSLVTSTYAPTAENYNRVVFQWEGHPGTYLQETADISAFARVDRLGADVGEIPRYAEIYSFPVKVGFPDGIDDIDIVATVTDDNCGQDLIAQSFTIFPGLVDLQFKDIRITLSPCDHIGDTISLNKILGEQTLAAK